MGGCREGWVSQNFQKSFSYIIRWFAEGINLVIPLKCVRCGEILADQEGLCPSCWVLIPFIIDPFCVRCGLPFEFEIEEGALCPSCSSSPPFYTTARAVFQYSLESRELILKFKHLDGINVAPLFARWMVQKSEVEGEDILCVPVPLHWTRLFMRTYNQAALLAQNIAKIKKWTYSPRVLVRIKRTPSQGRLSKKERVENMGGAFKVPVPYKSLLEGKSVVLVDDVLTTGATLNACSKALLKAGVKEIHVLTLGRVMS